MISKIAILFIQLVGAIPDYQPADKIAEPAAAGTGTASAGCHACIRSGHAYYSKGFYFAYDDVAAKTAALVTGTEGYCCKNSNLQADCTGALDGTGAGTLKTDWNGYPKQWTATDGK